MNTRTTKVKTRVMDIFQQHTVPLTLQEVYTAITEHLPNTVYSTVYRFVLQLKKEKKILSLDYRDRGGRFEWADRQHHHHVTCNACGAVTDIDDDMIHFTTQAVVEKTGFVVDHHTIELYGRCKPCQKAA